MRFNSPPNWPTPPEGWQPPPGWRPDPSWGPPPLGWDLWVDDQPSADHTSVDNPRSKLVGAIKHPVWIGIGTVVGVLALGVSGFTAWQANSPSNDRLSIAAVTLGVPVDLSAVEEGATGYPEDVYPTDDIAAAPIDVTFKNDGGSVASIRTVTSTIVRMESLQSCDPEKRGAGGVSVAAKYSLQIPRGDRELEPVSNSIDFKVDPGETGRLAVTIGPESQAKNQVYVFAVRLSFGLDDGTMVETGPVVIGTTGDIIDEFISQAANEDSNDARVAKLCEPELAKIEDVVSVGGTIAEPVARLREAFQRLTAPSRAPASPPNASSPSSGDLNLDQPMSRPSCNGQGIVVLGSVTTPGHYEGGVQRLLAAHPGASYLRTDQTCPSLRAATDEGHPIYAVYRPAGDTEAEVCAAVRSAGGDAYGKWLDHTTDPSFRIQC